MYKGGAAPMRAIRKYNSLYLMIVPVLAYFAVMSYYPLLQGFVMSLQKFRLIGDRPFIGLDNYDAVWSDPAFWQSVTNTFWVGGGTLLLGFAAPLIAALSLNEVLHSGFKKATQMIIYLPHLFSWVIVGGVWIFILSPDGGLVNELLKLVGQDQPIAFFAKESYGRWIMILSATWKEMGFTCVIYLAAIVSINPALYEAARIDGANRFQQLLRITLPQLAGTMKVVLLLGLLGVVRVFDQIFVMKNPAIASKVDVLMIYTYEKGILQFNMGVASAASFLVVLLTLILTFAVRYAVRFDKG
jgi:putative aldouronate transport system permease protein